MNSQQKKSTKWLKSAIGFLLITLFFVGWKAYQTFLGASVVSTQEYFFVNTDDSYETVRKKLEDQKIVEDIGLFDFVAKTMEYPTSVKAGRYKIEAGMSNRRLVGNLRAGYQEAVKFRFENLRLKENFAGLLGKNFEADSIAFEQLLQNDSLAASYGFTSDNFFSMFIPNTYEIYWNTAPLKIIDRFHEEYQRFWTAERKEKAAALNLTPQEVSILASIVKGEALHKDEMPAIAGLYLNRLQKGMLLQADPTVIFANNDFSIRRVLNKHLTIDNPYNTYKFKGLPPGPIMLPSISSIDAVLNFKEHEYIYMCAKDDFSGYHNFAVTVAEHQINARKFQQALDARNIKK